MRHLGNQRAKFELAANVEKLSNSSERRCELALTRMS